MRKIPTHTLHTIAAGFPFPTNMGLHGDLQFFEMPNHQMTAPDPVSEGDTITFTYICYDSDEGEVNIAFKTICGSDASDPDAEGFDVIITTGSDTWDVAETASAVADAVALHAALGRMNAKK